MMELKGIQQYLTVSQWIGNIEMFVDLRAMTLMSIVGEILL